MTLTAQPVSIGEVHTNDEVTAAAIRRMRAEIVAKYGSIAKFSPLVTTAKKDALLDNLNGTSMPKFNVVVEILSLLNLTYDELMRRAEQDLEGVASE